MKIPRRDTKKWTTAYKGDYLGDIVGDNCIDLFSSPGKVKSGSKIYPHTTTDTTPAAFTTANISNGSAREAKVWAVSDSKKIYRTPLSTLVAFTLDTGTGFSSTEDTGTGSDIISVGDQSDAALNVIPIVIPQGNGGADIFGTGDKTKFAQKVTNLGGPFKSLSFRAMRTGTPADNLVISIEEDDGAGAPDGTPVLTASLTSGEVATTMTTETIEVASFTPTSYQFDASKTYWLVFSRSGSASLSNYYSVGIIQSSVDQYENGEMLNYNGTDWTRVDTYRTTEVFLSDGTWTCPAGVTTATVEAWGAGGGGTTDTGAGGGGEYARSDVSVTPSTGYAVVIGTSAADTNGGATTFNSTTVVANGGLSGTNGGTGGTGGTGDKTANGGNGSIGTGTRYGGGSAGFDVSSDAASVGSNGGTTYPGRGGLDSGALGDSRVPGGGAKSTAASQAVGGKGILKVTYDISVTAGYPVVRDRSYGASYSGSGSYYATLPRNAMPGDLVVAVIFAADSATTISMPSSWTQLDSVSGLASQAEGVVYYRRIDGGETSSDLLITTSSTKNISYIMYAIKDAGTPISASADGSSASVDAPNISFGETAKYLIIAAGGLNAASSAINVTAFPASYDNPFIQPENGYGSGGSPSSTNMGARAISAERLVNSSSENPGAFTVDASKVWVAFTIAVPYDNGVNDDGTYDLYRDITSSIEVEFPQANERLYVTTTKDVKFLNEDDGVWQSLWQGILGNDPLDSNYPHPMKALGAGGTLIVGDGNKVHTMTANASDPSEGTANRIVFDDNYYVNWIVVTKSSVFIGLRNKLSANLPSQICYYEPYSETTRIFTINEGETVGWFKDENCHVLDKSGQMRYFSGSAFVTYDHFPTFYSGSKITTLPHRNGIYEKEGQISFLWEGQYPYPSGVWVYDDGRLYHKKSLVFSNTTLNSYGALEGNGSWKALHDAGDNIFAGAIVENDSLSDVIGIFSDKNLGTVDSEARGHFVTSKETSADIDRTWQRIYVKTESRPNGTQTGEIKVKHRQSNPPISPTEAFTGTWTSATTFTCDTTNFKTYVDNATIVVGDEIIVRTGQGGGLLAHITDIAGASGATKTVTIDEGITAVSSGSFTFSVENWRLVTNNKTLGKISEENQVKVEIRDSIEVVEVNVTSAEGKRINE